MSWLIITLFIAGGLLLLILELLVIPGTTVVGIAGFILMVVGIWNSFMHYGNSIGFMVLGATVAVSGGVLYYSLRSNTWNKAMLHTAIDSKVNTEASVLNIGDQGKSISRINPMGKALFDNAFYEVSSFGGFIDEDVEIKIVEIQGNKILVEKNSPLKQT
ncbi:MAG: hypothetical protein B7C24_16825 [Bacteroidetes bacterium 4572_77]|nr:MAG: hypothetical protein B7C24_16825 [Bacteroidetes bacterium 4572_77]